MMLVLPEILALQIRLIESAKDFIVQKYIGMSYVLPCIVANAKEEKYIPEIQCEC